MSLLNKLVFVSGRPSQPSLMFVNKAELTQVIHLSGTPLWGKLQPYTQTLGLPAHKRSSLLRKFVNYGGRVL
jgi:hypothetical protein